MDVEENSGPSPNWLDIFDKRITLGSLITMITIAVYGSLLYAQISAHISSPYLHMTPTEREVFFNTQFDRRAEPVLMEMRYNYSTLQRELQEVKNEIQALRRDVSK